MGLSNLMYKIFDASMFDRKSLESKGLKLAEEAGEVAGAILSYNGADGCVYKAKTREHVLEELIDVIMVAGAMIYLLEGGRVDEEEIDIILDKKIGKWLNKIGVSK